MQATEVKPKDNIEKPCRLTKNKLKRLRISLKYRPEILKLILKMRECIRKKTLLLKKIKKELKQISNHGVNTSSKEDDKNVEPKKEPHRKTINNNVKNSSTQTDTPIGTHVNEISTATENNTAEKGVKEDGAWNISKDDEVKSIAEQVKEAAQSALQQSGMVYVESAGMYYDYKTGYYYNTELGLYYHTDTGCYYCYSEEKKEFVFHSYPDRNALAANASLQAHEKRKAKKHKKALKTKADIDNLTKNLSQDKEDEASKPKKRRKTDKKKIAKEKEPSINNSEDQNDMKAKSEVSDKDAENKEGKNDDIKEEDLEDGECSDTGSEKSNDEDSDASTSTASDDDMVAKHHPPCMRVIVRETSLPKLKVGSLFLVTKDGGTIGREGDKHAILIPDHNVSRNHLDIRYDMHRRIYLATDLGSKNGTMLNGIQMSESQVVSKPMEVIHGSTIQLSETKLLCHIHAGNDTCGHCEPGLIMETQEKEKVAYTRTCSVQKQYQLELARLKNKYTPEPLMIEEGSYNDRAKARRETVGSSHHSEKTQSTNVETFIAPENKGFKLLEKMGWSKGEGLGKDSQGETEPIPLVSNEGKAGLGTPGSVGAPPMVPLPKVRNTLGPATLRLATKSKLLQLPAKAFQNPLQDDSD